MINSKEPKLCRKLPHKHQLDCLLMTNRATQLHGRTEISSEDRTQLWQWRSFRPEETYPLISFLATFIGPFSWTNIHKMVMIHHPSNTLHPLLCCVTGRHTPKLSRNVTHKRSSAAASICWEHKQRLKISRFPPLAVVPNVGSASCCCYCFWNHTNTHINCSI